MKNIVLLSALLVLASASAAAQSKRPGVYIDARTQPESAGGVAADLATHFETRLEQLIWDTYPCAEPRTRAEAATLLNFDRERQLLGGSDEGMLTKIAGEIGAEYLVAFTVTPFGTDQYRLNASMTNVVNLSSVAKANATAAGKFSDAAGAVEGLARQMVRGMGGLKQLAKEKCDPTNAWTGTVTYHAEENTSSHEGGEPAAGEDGRTVSNERSSSYDAKIRIGWTGEPTAQVTAKETRRSLEVVVARYDCGGPGKHNWRSAGTREETSTESSAEQTAQASVAASLKGGKFHISIGVPQVEGLTTVTNQKRFDGRCDEPTSSTQSAESEWTASGVDYSIDVKPGNDPSEQSGTNTDKNGVTVTWNLKRTRM